MELTHLDKSGRAMMVNVSRKRVTSRHAKARGVIYLRESTLEAITEGKLAKGDAFAVARTAGIMAAKRCDELIPLCHAIPLEHVSVDMEPLLDPPRVEISAEVTCSAKTGVEMEAILAVSISAIAIYDMVKAIDRTAVIGDIRLMEKSGGRSGHFVREEVECKPE
jgi:cyclic pyranopterin phosphate synthase